ncbi:MAG: DUF6875 domain-containing protein [Pseudomonadota bacterium]
MNASDHTTATRGVADPGTRAPTAIPAKTDFLLRRASEVEAANDPDSPLGAIVSWVRRFLARPHPDVGRAGPVCPFTPMALELDTIWMTEIVDAEPDPQRIQDVVEQCRQMFLDAEPREGAMAINKVFMIVFSSLDASAAPLIDAIQARLKPGFVDVGLMLGEFHARNDTPGLRNAEFRPLRSPIPMLVIRHMVESDLPFLKREIDAPQVRGSYLRSYLRRLGGSIRRNYFDQAVDALVEAEMEMRHGGEGARR